MNSPDGNGRPQLSWTPPDETERGATLYYVVAVERSAEDCVRFAVVNDTKDCGETKVIVTSQASLLMARGASETLAVGCCGSSVVMVGFKVCNFIALKQSP